MGFNNPLYQIVNNKYKTKELPQTEIRKNLEEINNKE